MSAPPLRRRSLLGSIAAFGAVGLAASLMHVIVGLTLVHTGTLAPFSANIVAFLSAFLISYFGHRRYSFDSSAKHSRSLPRFLAVALLGLVLNQILVWIVVDRLGFAYAYCLVLLVTVVPAVTYVLSRYWAFSDIEDARATERARS